MLNFIHIIIFLGCLFGLKLIIFPTLGLIFSIIRTIISISILFVILSLAGFISFF